MSSLFNSPVSLTYRLYRKFLVKTGQDKTFGRPHYLYSLKRAFINAKHLELKKISFLEFGVASGRGLLALERMAEELSKEYDITFEIYGFDLELGMPKPEDYKDLPFVWSEGMYPMNKEELERKLKYSKLVLGDIKDTIIDFIEKCNPAPIAFISFDVDYYSSTMSCFKLFENSTERFLPRLVSYLDDVISIEFVGQRLAISDFNKRNEKIKIGQEIEVLQNKEINGYRIFDTHFFEHPLYNKTSNKLIKDISKITI